MNGSEIEIGGKLTKRYDVLRSDHEDDRWARVARVRFRGEVGGGDYADYEAELLESPACRSRRVSTQSGFCKPNPSTLFPSHLQDAREREKALTHDNPPRSILLWVVGRHCVDGYPDRANDRREDQGHQRVFGDVRAVSAFGQAECDFIA